MRVPGATAWSVPRGRESRLSKQAPDDVVGYERVRGQREKVETRLKKKVGLQHGETDDNDQEGKQDAARSVVKQAHGRPTAGPWQTHGVVPVHAPDVLLQGPPLAQQVRRPDEAFRPCRPCRPRPVRLRMARSAGWPTSLAASVSGRSGAELAKHAVGCRAIGLMGRGCPALVDLSRLLSVPPRCRRQSLEPIIFVIPHRPRLPHTHATPAARPELLGKAGGGRGWGCNGADHQTRADYYKVRQHARQAAWQHGNMATWPARVAGSASAVPGVCCAWCVAAVGGVHLRVRCNSIGATMGDPEIRNGDQEHLRAQAAPRDGKAIRRTQQQSAALSIGERRCLSAALAWVEMGFWGLAPIFSPREQLG